MLKADCEKAVRSLRHAWITENDPSAVARMDLSCSFFIAWLRQNHSACLNFRTTTGVEYDVEMWFDDELQLNWTR